MGSPDLDLPRRGLILGSAAALAASACAPRHGPAAGVLNVAGQKGTTRAVVDAAGALQGAPYKVAWSEFAAASPLLEALGANAVDIGGVGDAPFIFAYAAGAKIKAVFAYRTAVSGASIAVVAPTGSPIRTVAGLRGRKVATVKGSVGHYLLLRLLDQAGLPLDAATAVFLSPGDCKAALDRGSVDNPWPSGADPPDLAPVGGARGEGEQRQGQHSAHAGRAPNGPDHPGRPPSAPGAWRRGDAVVFAEKGQIHLSRNTGVSNDEASFKSRRARSPS